MLSPNFLSLCAIALLAGCAAPPRPLADSHPASTRAPEGGLPPRDGLLPDGETRRTRALLAGRAREAAAAEKEAPSPESHDDL